MNYILYQQQKLNDVELNYKKDRDMVRAKFSKLQETYAIEIEESKLKDEGTVNKKSI